MKQKKRWLPYLAAAGAAAAVVLLTVWFEVDTYGTGPALYMHFFSDGFFTAAVLLLGCGVLMLIAETGSFYGMQYLGYILVRQFSVRKARFDDRKSYFDYCTEKKARQKENGPSPVKRGLLAVGAVCLLLAAVFAALFYRLV